MAIRETVADMAAAMELPPEAVSLPEPQPKVSSIEAIMSIHSIRRFFILFPRYVNPRQVRGSSSQQ